MFIQPGRTSKLRDPSHALLAANLNPSTENGPAFLWDWRNDEMIELGGGSWGADGSSHDIQWSSDSSSSSSSRGGGGGDGRHATAETAARGGGAASFVDDGTNDDGGALRGGAYWRTTQHGAIEYDAMTGVALHEISKVGVKDTNHLQILSDGHAVLNGRMTHDFVKTSTAATTKTATVDGDDADDDDAAATGAGNVWICGGAQGTLDLTDSDGTVYPAGTGQPWYGQHNTEYFGNGESSYFLPRVLVCSGLF